MAPRLLIAAAAAAAYFAAARAGWPLAALLLKPVPALALSAAVLTRSGRMARLLAAGLACGALGDVLLEVDHFLAGLGAFLAGHLFYAAGFSADGAPLRPWRLLPFAAWSALMTAYLWPGLGSVRLAVVVYAAAFTATMWRAAARLPVSGAAVGVAGAVLFAASDSLLALDRFRGVHGVRWAIMPLYWAGQAGIAGSVLWRTR